MAAARLAPRAHPRHWLRGLLLGAAACWLCWSAVDATAATMIALLFAWPLLILRGGDATVYGGVLFIGGASAAGVSPGAWAMLIAWLGLFAAAGWMCRRHDVLRVLTVLALFAWLLWPVWLAPSLVGVIGSGSLPSAVTTLHPSFAAGASIGGNWPESAWGYKLTPLGQDLVYASPTSAWPAVMTHLVVAGIVVGVTMLSRRRSQAAH